MNPIWSYVMNVTLVRLLFISHHEVSINISVRMTESSIQSLWQPSASFLLESVVHNNSSTQIAIPKINERTGRQLMDALRGGFRRTGAWSVPASSTTTHRFRVSQLDQNSISTPQTRFKCKVKRPKPSVQEYFRAVRDQQITTDFHIDCLAHGKTLAKKRKTSNDVLYQICENFCQYDSVLSYMFEVAKHFEHDQ